MKSKRVKRTEINERVKVAYQLRTLIGADKRLFYDLIWLWPAPPAPSNVGMPQYGPLETQSTAEWFCNVLLKNPDVRYAWIKSHVDDYVVKLHTVRGNEFVTLCCHCEHDPTQVDNDVWYVYQHYQICRECYEKVKDIPNYFPVFTESIAHLITD